MFNCEGLPELLHQYCVYSKDVFIKHDSLVSFILKRGQQNAPVKCFLAYKDSFSSISLRYYQDAMSRLF